MEGKKAPLPIVCHTYPTMMKLGTVIPYLKKIKKFMNHVTHPLSSADISFFFPRNHQILLYQEILIAFWYIISNSFNFYWVFKDCFNKHGYNLTSTKMATPGLFKIKTFWNKGYDVIISVHDDTDRILSRDSNYIVVVVMWPKFGNSNISMSEVITSIL